MNKKLIIQIIVIVAAFAGAGVVLYNGLFKSSAGLPVASTAGATQQNILPYGTSMDFNSVLYQRNLQYNIVAFPVLNPSTDVGIPQDQLITPLPSTVKK